MSCYSAAIPQQVSHRYTKDGTRSPQGNSRAAASSTDARERRTHRKAQPRHPATITTTTTSTCSSPETQELIWDTEHILDQALDTSLRRGRKSTTADTPRGLPWPTRHLKLRTVRPVDVEYAEAAFNAARRRLAQLESRRRRRPQDEQTRDPQHVQVLTAHINHLLYLAARIPDPEAYARIRAFLRQYDLEPDSHTFLTRLILVDKTNQVDHVGAICQKFNRRVVPPRYALNERSSRGAKTIDGEDATVLLNMTMWILAKRAQWNIVGPAYNKLLKHTPHATTHISAAFPRDYFTPSHDLSFDLYFRNTTVLDKITYQSLIRALAFHGNVVPALAVMQDLLNDSRGYSVALSDFVALFQGFARFGRIPVGWEDLEVAAYARGAQGDAVYANARDELRPPAWDDEAPDVAIKSARRDPSIFPPPIFPEPSFPGCTMTTTPSTLSGRSHKMDAIKQMTEIWAGKVNAWDQHSESPSRQHSAPTRLEREWTLVTLQQVFQSFLAISPIADAPSPLASDTSRATTKKWWEPNLAEAPSPRSIYYIMLAFSRTTDTNVSVLREVWEQLERKFGEGNEEGWTGWRLDARLRRLKQWLAVGE
ncbi:hypothetical protein NliqN6_1661 [Naganishia liquefaciens]|uniref:Uncharacterized protein n=1 Tax=Naganishia liquefaciens TaxID=104408 RepID=A0A8H3TQS8_9TREE|nr:hypothetical protein NliqN6_1661 [Naganishia liquefaciens]